MKSWKNVLGVWFENNCTPDYSSGPKLDMVQSNPNKCKSKYGQIITNWFSVGID